MSKTWEAQLKKYAQEAYKYYSECTQICPCGDEIVEFVAQRVEDESGIPVDDEQFVSIAKILGIDVE